MTTATLLVELLTEELPPRSLRQLGQSFADEIFNGLARYQLSDRDITRQRVFATPRRLGVLIPEVFARAQDRENVAQGPAVNAAPAAIAGFAKKHGVAVDTLEHQDTPKGKVVAARVRIPGAVLDTVLAKIVSDALKKLPVAKLMRWGDGDAQFVRPVHGLIMLHGKTVVPGTVLGIQSGNRTRGHRFMGQAEPAITDADAYETVLAKEGMVIADFAQRRTMIDDLLQAAAKKQQAALGDYQVLLDEVTALVEHPSVYVGTFDAGFLEIPAECLILTMRQNQKYFPLFDAAGKLTSRFLIVSNMQVADPAPIISGNQRVIRPRLEDARFFYNQDRKARLETRVPQLGKVVYHN